MPEYQISLPFYMIVLHRVRNRPFAIFVSAEILSLFFFLSLFIFGIIDKMYWEM